MGLARWGAVAAASALAVAALFAVPLAGAQAAAPVRGDRLLAALELYLEAAHSGRRIAHASEGHAIGHAAGYVAGVAESLAAQRRVCLPAGLDALERAERVAQHLRALPAAARARGAQPAVARALADAYPCPR